MGKNIYVDLELPVGVRIDFDLFPRLPQSKAGRRMAIQESVDEVRRALLAWSYESDDPNEK